MDIYLPKKKAENQFYGSIIFIHGGSWTKGSKSSEETKCKDYALKGYVTSAINYHYVTEKYDVWDDMIDIELAIKKLNEFTKEKNYTLNGTSLYGYSSGAHLTTLFSYSRPEKAEIPIKFIVNKAGPIDFHSDTCKEWNYDENTGPRLSIALNGINNFKKYIVDGEIKTELIPSQLLENLINNVSSIYYINEESVPSICAYAGEDLVVPTKNKILILKKLEEKGIKYDFLEFKKSNHMLNNDPDMQKLLDIKIEEYCKTYFGY